MKITGTAIKLGAFSFVLLLFTAIIIIVFGQIRFDRTTAYTAEFSSASGLREGQFVRAGGVEVGKVSKLQLMDDGRRVLVTLNVDKTLPLYQSTTATIRYQDLIDGRTLTELESELSMTRFGAIRPLASRAGVVTGPQPPPPAASRNPPTSPSGATNPASRRTRRCCASCWRAPLSAVRWG